MKQLGQSEGVDAHELNTPCVVVDADKVRRNITRLADYCKSRGLAFRPHIKTHKSLAIARLQLEAGAVGLTVAKPGELEVMSELGAELLLAYPTITPASCEAVVRSLQKCAVIVAVDSEEAVSRLAAAVPLDGPSPGVLVDIDVGMHRTGVQSPNESLRLAQLVDAAPNLNLRGVFYYPGHIWDRQDAQQAAADAVSAILALHVDAWNDAGLRIEIASAGSTPTAYQAHQFRPLTEIRSGTYVFNDMNTVHGGYSQLEDCAARVEATVISNCVNGQVVVDAGSKSLGADRCISAPDRGHGFVVGYPDAMVTALSEEHGQIDVTRCARPPALGQRLSIIPNHICPVINLFDSVWWVEQGRAPQPLKIDARGRVH